jgi:hypothetical protein
MRMWRLLAILGQQFFWSDEEVAGRLESQSGPMFQCVVEQVQATSVRKEVLWAKPRLVMGDTSGQPYWPTRSSIWSTPPSSAITGTKSDRAMLNGLAFFPTPSPRLTRRDKP